MRRTLTSFRSLARVATVAATLVGAGLAQAGWVSPADVSFSPGDSTSAVQSLGGTAQRELFVSFELLFNGAIDRNDFAALQLRQTGVSNTAALNIGLKGNEDTNLPSALDYFVRSTASNAIYAPPNAVAGQSVWLYGHLFKDSGRTGGASGNFNVFQLWTLDSAATDLRALWASTPMAESLGDSGYSRLNGFAFRDANLDAGDSVQMRNIQIAYDVPEPGTLALLGLAGVAGWLRRARRA